MTLLVIDNYDSFVYNLARYFERLGTVVDAVRENLGLADRQILPKLGLSPKSYLLSTLHRQENVDSRERLTEILRGLELVSGESGLPTNPHYDDFIDKWRNIQYVPMWWDITDIKANAEGTLTLTP